MDEVERSIASARLGRTEALGREIEKSRDYLQVVARRELDPDPQAPVGDSDLVQEVPLAAQRDLAAFRGRTRQQGRARPRSILIHVLHNARCDDRSVDRRRIDREVFLAAATGTAFDLPADWISPGAKAQQREQEPALQEARRCGGGRRRISRS